MAVLKFKTFEALEQFEKEGKGINWNFRPDQAYFRKALRFKLKIPFPLGFTNLELLKKLKFGKGNGGSKVELQK
jgi:hypothetical protein